MDPVYFDNAATSWPKPPAVIEAMNAFNRGVGASPGRSGHRLSIEAGRVMQEARELLAELFNAGDSLRIAFTKNATEALNIAVFGLLEPGDHVITSSMEHNSVMRPLRHMERRGVELSIVRSSSSGAIEPDDIIPLIKKNTRAIFITHASNVTGTVIPVERVGNIAREHGLVFCVDAAQTAGSLPIDIETMNIDLLAFTGHKSLFGPQGTGGLYVRKDLEREMDFFMVGGTGSRSEFEEQPEFMPDRYEAGTPNAIGIAGFAAGVEFVRATGIDAIRDTESRLARVLVDGLGGIPGVTLYGTGDAGERMPVVSFNVAGMSPSDVSLRLDEEFNIMSRPGLHCAPAAHRSIGTLPEGTVRFSLGYFNTMAEVEYAVGAVGKIARG
ncbi:MAG: aminotransferase class V-fold PLP-dependent enzyme [Spirochaetes bacterium]|nr:aminotransferase class V-fold PLP-dependent enzyme [Spirochaetota bacterium]